MTATQGSADRLAARAALVSGLLLVTSIVLPVPFPSTDEFGAFQTDYLWLPSLLRMGAAPWKFAVLAPLVAGILLVIVSRLRAAWSLASLVGVGIALVVLRVLRTYETDFSYLGGSPQTNTIVLVAALSAFAGMRLTRSHPSHPLGPRLTGYSGAVLLGVLLIPTSADEVWAPVAHLLGAAGRLWTRATIVAAMGLLGSFSLMALGSGRDREGHLWICERLAATALVAYLALPMIEALDSEASLSTLPTAKFILGSSGFFLAVGAALTLGLRRALDSESSGIAGVEDS